MPCIEIEERINATIDGIDDEQLAVLWSSCLIEHVRLVTGPAMQPFVALAVALPMCSITYYWEPSSQYMDAAPQSPEKFVVGELIDALLCQGEGERGQIEGQLGKYLSNAG